MKEEPEVIVYTEGACSGNPGPGGWAAILRHPASGEDYSIGAGGRSGKRGANELTKAATPRYQV